jgi:hypothetical protein
VTVTALFAPSEKTRRSVLPSQDDEAYLDTRQVASECGLKCRQSVGRWRTNPKLAFPAPDARINGRVYWMRGTIRRWKAKMAADLKAAQSQTESVK